MVRRALLIIIAVALAAAGTLLLMRWVDGAVDRETAGVELVEALVATEPIPEGTPSEQMAERVELRQIFAQTQVPGAVIDLEDLAGLVADVDILAGEQLTTQRFVDPAERVQDLIPQVEVPEGYLEVSFAVAADQFVGGDVEPGDLVAFIATFDPFTIVPNAIEPGAVGGLDELLLIIQQQQEEDATAGGPDLEEFQTPNTTHIMFHKVLVTQVQYGEPPALVDEEGNPIEQDPRAVQPVAIVTLAAPAPDIERMVFTHEFGRIWFAKETPDDPEDGTDFITRGNVFP